MSDELYSIILKNPIIIETLFHIKNYKLNIINSNKRTFIKITPFNEIYNYLPILRNFIKDDNEISYFITETYQDNSIIYEIKLNNHHLFNDYQFIYNLKFFICFSIDNTDKNKINISLKTNKINDEINPINQTIINIISNYLENDHMDYIKNNIIHKELKPLFSSINHRSFVLNII